MTRPPAPGPSRPLRTAELLAVGSELTAGETRDTNGGELAASLAGHGVGVRRIVALPDRLELVRAAFEEALGAVDLVVSTGGLGPTPDDLTREALAAAVGEEPAVDPALERWLRGLFARRGMELPPINLKQAWLIPSATAITNPNGTAPGWWVDRPDGRVAVLLPGPPRELRPMWSDWVLPRLRDRSLGDGRMVRTLRLYGIGESMVAERLGAELLAAENPQVATYARADWLDVRVATVDVTDGAGAVVTPAATLLEETVAGIRSTLGDHVWAEGTTSWADLVAEAAQAAGVRFATVEAGTDGQLAALLAGVPALARSTVLGPSAARPGSLEDAAADAARDAGTEMGLALEATDADHETLVRASAAGPAGAADGSLDLRLFQHGPHGRFRAAVAGAAFLVERLRDRTAAP